MEERVGTFEGTAMLASDCISLPRNEYNALIDAKTRLDIIRQYFISNKYLGAEDIRLIIGFTDEQAERSEADG